MPVGPVTIGPPLRLPSRTHLNEGARPEGRLGVIRKPDGDDHDTGHTVVDSSPERDPGRSRLEWLQHGLVMTDPFGEQRHLAPLDEQPPTGTEAALVARRRLTVFGPVHGDDPGELQKGPQRKDPKKRRLPEKMRKARQRGHQQQQRVDQPVYMVGHDHRRHIDGQVSETLQLDPTEEDPDQQPGQSPHRPISGPAHGRDAR